MVMGLRLSEGIEPQALAGRFGRPVVNERAVTRLVASGHLERSGNRLRTTPAGRLLLDRILAEIAAD
jgi:oxygen-independent coproporphyrinogen-3 oxidase